MGSLWQFDRTKMCASKDQGLQNPSNVWSFLESKRVLLTQIVALSQQIFKDFENVSTGDLQAHVKRLHPCPRQSRSSVQKQKELPTHRRSVISIITITSHYHHHHHHHVPHHHHHHKFLILSAVEKDGKIELCGEAQRNTPHCLPAFCLYADRRKVKDMQQNAREVIRRSNHYCFAQRKKSANSAPRISCSNGSNVEQLANHFSQPPGDFPTERWPGICARRGSALWRRGMPPIRSCRFEPQTLRCKFRKVWKHMETYYMKWNMKHTSYSNMMQYGIDMVLQSTAKIYKASTKAIANLSCNSEGD